MKLKCNYLMILVLIILFPIFTFANCPMSTINDDTMSVVIETFETEGLAPFTLQFNGLDSSSTYGDIVDYCWDFSDLNSQYERYDYGQMVGHRFDDVGSYNVYLTITDEVGNSKRESITINSLDRPGDALIYYVSSSSGDNSNSGLCSSDDGNGCGPWETFDYTQNQGLSMPDGSQVLFKRGDIFDTSKLHLEFSAASLGNFMREEPYYIKIGSYGIGDYPYFTTGLHTGGNSEGIGIIIEELHLNGSLVGWPSYYSETQPTGFRYPGVQLHSRNCIMGGFGEWASSGVTHENIYVDNNDADGGCGPDLQAFSEFIYWNNITVLNKPGHGVYFASWPGNADTPNKNILIENSEFAYNGLGETLRDGFTIHGATDNFVFRNNHVHHNGYGVGWDSAYAGDTVEYNRNFVMEECIFHDQVFYTTQLSSQQNFIIRNNIFHNNAAGIIDIRTPHNYDYDDEDSFNIKIYNNVFYNNTQGYGGAIMNIAADQVHDVYIYNNVFYDNDNLDYVVYDLGSEDLTISNNLYYDNNPNYAEISLSHLGNFDIDDWISSGNEVGIINENPLFVDAENYDFRLQKESSAIDSGIIVNSIRDINDNLRPIGSGYDLGVYEFENPNSSANTNSSITNLRLITSSSSWLYWEWDYLENYNEFAIYIDDVFVENIQTVSWNPSDYSSSAVDVIRNYNYYTLVNLTPNTNYKISVYALNKDGLIDSEPSILISKTLDYQIFDSVCGNNVKDDDEICDGIDFGGLVCYSVGNWTGGKLKCNSDCSGFDTMNCIDGNTIEASSCDYTNVLDAFNLASTGDIIKIPEGSCIWSEQLIVNKPVSIIGSGKDKTLITSAINDRSSSLIRFELDDSNFVRLSGINFDGNSISSCVEVSGSWQIYTTETYPIYFRIDNNKFYNCNRSGVRVVGYSAGHGLIDQNDFIDNFKSSDVYGEELAGWYYPIRLGTASSVYMENNNFVWETCVDGGVTSGGQGGKYVWRYNNFTSLDESCYADPLDCHGNQEPILTQNNIGNLDFEPGIQTSETGVHRGTVSFEIYENILNVPKLGRFFSIRGGTGVIYNNIMTATYNPMVVDIWEEEAHRFTFWYENHDLTYPGMDGINNLYIWNNMMNGILKPITTKNIGEEYYSQKDRDFFEREPNKESDFWYGYLPLDYPHPMVHKFNPNQIHDADTDENGYIEMDELVNYIQSWRNSNAIRLSDLIEAIRLWKN